MPSKRRSAAELNKRAAELEHNNCFIACEVIDRSDIDPYHIGYDKRYLDALSSILHVGTPCAAIIAEKIIDGNVILRITYNNTLPKNDVPLINALEKTINDTISLIQQHGANIDDASKVLLYANLLLNKDFYPTIKTLNHKNEDPSSKKVIGDLCSQINAAQAKLKLLLKSQKLIDAGDDATMFNILGPYVILGSGARLVTHEGKAANKFDMLLEQNNIGNTVSDVLDSYYSLIRDQSLIKFTQIYKLLLRPLQDVTKLLCYLTREGISSIMVNEVPNDSNKILNGVEELHAEINLAFYQVKHELNSYIGITKLSCPPCDKVLGVLGYEELHRGTHGLCFNGWQQQLALSQVEVDEQRQIVEAFENILVGINKSADTRYTEVGMLDQQTLLRQYRKLSTDDEYEIGCLAQCKRQLKELGVVELEEKNDAPQPEGIEAAPQPEEIEAVLEPEEIEAVLEPEEIEAVLEPEEIEAVPEHQGWKTVALNGSRFNCLHLCDDDDIGASGDQESMELD